MDLGLNGKKALVTGATKGIGRAIAETLLDEGASVAICARTESDVDDAVSTLSSKGTVVGRAVDAGDGEALAAWVTESADALGGIDIYVHNTSGKPARKPEHWINNFNIDLMALVLGVGAATPATPTPSPRGWPPRPRLWAASTSTSTTRRPSRSASPPTGSTTSTWT